MPSEAELAAAPEARVGWLRSQGLGLVCGFLAVLLLGAGSLVLTATREGASANVGMDDLTGFFRPPSIAHLWFYLLIPVLALYGVNTALCTFDAVLGKWRRGVREVSAYAPSVIHLSFLFALLGHGVGGLWSFDRPTLILGEQWQPISRGRELRLLEVKTESLPNGQPRSIEAKVEVRAADGSTHFETIGYNQPLSSGLGSDLWLLAKAGQRARGARVSTPAGSCVVAAGGSCMLGQLRLEVSALHESGHWGQVPLVVARATDGPAAGEGFFVLEGQEHRLRDGTVVRFERLESAPAIALRSRFAPGHPFALASVVLLGAGLALMGRRWG